MTSVDILSSYIKKLSHPLREIRERSLQLLTAKLELGWRMDDELGGTREMLEGLLAWFQAPHPSLQREALQLLLNIIKTESGTYIVKGFGIRNILSSLTKAAPKMEPEALELYHDVKETLRFLNTVVSEENVRVPSLHLNSIGSSETENSSCGYYNIPPDVQSSKESSVSNEENRWPSSKENKSGIRMFIFPWAELCCSDTKTILLVEDALKLLKSTRRCCRFIRDVFLRDFPVEVFLNRPIIVQSLLSISDGSHGSRPVEALNVLLCITQALTARLQQLSCLDLVSCENKQLFEENGDNAKAYLELEEITGDGQFSMPSDNNLAPLKQLPAPVYSLDILHIVLPLMARSVALYDSTDRSELLDLKELNTCLCLTECSVQLLLQCITDQFWRIEHNSKTLRDLAHKSFMVMRLTGDLMMKYRKSYYDDNLRVHHRVAWLRLVPCAEALLTWIRDSALPPTIFVQAMQAAQLDPALSFLYPDLSRSVVQTLENSKSSVDQEYKSKYRELKKLLSCMCEAAKFMKNKNACCDSKKVLSCIKDSLPTLEMHLNEDYLNKTADILLCRAKDLDFEESDWSIARSIAVNLMAHNIEWVRAKFYTVLEETVRVALMGDEDKQSENEKCLMLLCDVSVLTEICCHGISSTCREISTHASGIMTYLLRGRLALSEGCWWRLLASLRPVFPLLHAYAAHDTPLGKAICKSLEPDIAECMGVSQFEVTSGLIRLLFVRCPAVQLDAAHSLCCLLDDEKYLPPKQSLRVDVLLSALRRAEPQEFNVVPPSSPSKSPQTAGLTQILDVLKQDIVLDEHGSECVIRGTMQPMLEASLRRSTLQQLAVMIRQQEFHDTFIQCDGLKVTIAILRMSMMVDDYLAFPECAISCISILNSVCFTSRHSLAKVPDLHSLLIRAILVFPSNDTLVSMAAQVMSLVAWSGFALQELDSERRRVPALPFSVTQRTSLPFVVNSYWNTSPNSEHSSVEWLLSDEEFRTAIRVHWWCAFEGSSQVLRGAPPPPVPFALRPTAKDLYALRDACPRYSCAKALLSLENATSHRQVNDALWLMESYIHLLRSSSVAAEEFAALPWQHMRRFLSAPPASSRDTALLLSLLRFLVEYMDNVPTKGGTMTWIKSTFIGNDASVICLLGREEFYPQQSPQENIEITQLHIHIVKVLLRCVILLENYDEYDNNRMESLVKILLACLERVDLKNFHMLGYLNELVRSVRYALNSRYCKLSEDTLLQSLRVLTSILSGSAAGGGRKGQACRLDTTLGLLALQRQIQEEAIPVQRWCEAWHEAAVTTLVRGVRASRPELRAAALQACVALAQHAALWPRLLQAITEDSLSQFAVNILCNTGEANIVRAAASSLLTVIAARASPQSDILEQDVLQQLKGYNFSEICVDILVEFCSERNFKNNFEPNIPISILERRTEFEVRAHKSVDIRVAPSISGSALPPPTPALVAALADTLYNVCNFASCPVQAWNERGLYRLLFRCASSNNGSISEILRVRASVYRTLSFAANHKCVRMTLATTKDCLHNVMVTLTPFDEDDVDEDCLSACTHAFWFLGSLLTERAACDNVWDTLRDKCSETFFHSLLQCLDSKDIELQNAGMFCLTKLAQSATAKKYTDKTKDHTRVELLNNVKSPFFEDVKSSRSRAGDDCQPEYMAEEICKLLMGIYQKLSLDQPSRQEEQWSRVCWCLSAVLSASLRSRLYGVHRQIPKILLSSLQIIRDKLSLQGTPEVVKNCSKNPLIRILYWVLTCINCHMLDCGAAKDSFADDNMAVSLNRLWPWCMLTEQLREAVVHLLVTFTNDSQKGWASMSTCVSGRSLIGEVCVLTAKEASLSSRPKPDMLLLMSLRILRQTMFHHHCRTIIIKSEALMTLYKLRISDRSATAVGIEWARAVEVLARFPEGAALLPSVRPSALAPRLRAAVLPALAHLARHRAALRDSHCATEMLELLSGTLLAGDIAEIVSAARAVWALAANNHRAKLLLRSAGIPSAVQSALQRVQRDRTDPAAQRATQLLMYTSSVLQTT